MRSEVKHVAQRLQTGCAPPACTPLRSRSQARCAGVVGSPRADQQTIYLSATREIRPLLLEQQKKATSQPPLGQSESEGEGEFSKAAPSAGGNTWRRVVREVASVRAKNIIRRTVRTYSSPGAAASTSSALAATSAVSWAPAPPQHQAGYPVEKPQEKVKVEGEKVKFGEQEKVPGATA